MSRAYTLRGLVFSAALILAAAAPAWAQGKLEILEGDTYDWGRVAPGQLKAVISVKNAGDAPLKISQVSPSCGCTAAPIDKDLLQPGEIGKISVTMNATGSGPTRKTLSILSDDPKNPKQTVHLVADIRPVLTFEPKNFFLVNNAQVGVPVTTSVTIVNRSDETITIGAPTLVQANVTMKFATTEPVKVKAGEKVELKAEITPLQAGPISGEVKVTTTTTQYPEVVFNVWGSAEPASSTGPEAK